MKDVQSIIVLVSVSFLMFFGVSLIGQQAFENGNLDEESINAMALYDDRVGAFQANFTAVQDSSESLTDYEPDANLIDEFIKEYSEGKDKVNQLKSAVLLVYKLPDLMILSVPFVEESDLTVYRNVIWFLISVAIFIALFNAVANRRINNPNA